MANYLNWNFFKNFGVSARSKYTEHKQLLFPDARKMRNNELIKTLYPRMSNKKMVTGVQPFPLIRPLTFRSQYLAGFQAEKRDIEYQAP